MYNKINRLFKVFLLCVMILFVISISYVIYRSTVIRNDDILCHYEEYEPTIKKSVLTEDVTYYDYNLEDGWVSISDGYLYRDIIIKDEKRGFIKHYIGNVLYTVRDLYISDLCKILFDNSMLCSMTLRTEEECAQINQLLEAKDYDAISEMNLEIIKTTSGTVYVE